MDQKSKTSWWWIVGLVVVIIVIYFATSGGSSTTSGDVIKLGWVGPLTGEAAAYGEVMKNVTELTVNEVNKNGGVDGKQLQVIYEDGKCAGKDSANATQKLVNVDKVQIVFGYMCSGESLAGVPIAAASKVLIFSAGSSSPKLTGISPYYFRDYPSDASQGKILADISYNNKGWRKVAFIQEQTDYALGIFNAFNDEFTKLGGTVVKEEFPTGTSDFRSSLTKLKSEKPNALFVDTQTPDAADRIFKQLSELAWKEPLLISDAIAGDPATLQKNAVLLEGTLAAEFGTSMSNPKFSNLFEAYKKAYGTDMTYLGYGAAYYDAIYLLKDGIEAVGNNGEKLAAWSRTIKDWQGASGVITIESTGDRASGHTPEVIKNGKTQPFSQ